MILDRPLEPMSLLEEENEKEKLAIILSSIESLLGNSSSERTTLPGSITIAITGDWGSGKTTYLKALESYFRDYRKVPVLFFEAWKFQGDQDPLVSLLLAIKEMRGLKGLAKARLSRILKPLLVSGLTLTDLAMKTALSTGIEDMEKMFKLVEKEGLRLASRTRDNMELLKRTLKEITANHLPPSTDDTANKAWAEFCQSQGITPASSRPFVLIVDDLDRLIPREAFSMIETLRFYFDIENVLIIMGLNDELLNKYVKIRYMLKDESGENFIEKIFQWNYELSYTELNGLHINSLGTLLSEEEMETLKDLLNSLDNLTHRKWVKLVNRIEKKLLATKDQAERASILPHIVFTAVLKELYPQFESYSRKFPGIAQTLLIQDTPGHLVYKVEEALGRINKDKTCLEFPRENFDNIKDRINRLLGEKEI